MKTKSGPLAGDRRVEIARCGRAGQMHDNCGVHEGLTSLQQEDQEQQKGNWQHDTNE